MKKIIVLIASLVLLTGVLAGCSAAPAGNDGASENTPADVQESEKDDVIQEDEAAWPRTIIDGAGNEIVLEKAPERVSLLHIIYMEHFLLLDSPPTASVIGNKLGQTELLEDSEMFAPYVADFDIEVLGSARDLNLEAVLESDPDVMVTFYNPAGLATYDQLVQIAPVVQIDFSVSWQEQFLAIAQILGKDEDAQSIIKEIEKTLSDAKEELSKYSDKTFALFRTDGKGFIAQGGAAYYEILGLTKPEGFGDVAETLSLEAVAEMNPSYIVFQHNYEISKALVDSVESSSVWQSIDAVKNGHVYYFDENMNSFGPLALKLASKKITEIYSK